MDEIDLKRALRGYVTADVPPFPVTASDLVAKGRRRQLWRAGWAGLGSAGMAGITVFVASAVMTPSFGPNQVAPPIPGLSVAGCDQPLPQAGSPIALPTNDAPSAASSAEPTQYPSAEPTQHAEEEPSSHPTEVTSGLPSDQPVETPRWPSTAPQGPLPADADPAKIEAMACYVRGAAVLLFPNATFAPASEPPMQVVRWPHLDFATGWQPVYNIRARVIEGPRTGMFVVQVFPLPQATQTPAMPEVEVRSLGNGRTAYIDRGPHPMIVRVTTQRSSIIIWFDDMLTVEEAIALAIAPQLDLFS